MSATAMFVSWRSNATDPLDIGDGILNSGKVL